VVGWKRWLVGHNSRRVVSQPRMGFYTTVPLPIAMRSVPAVGSSAQAATDGAASPAAIREGGSDEQ